MFKNIIYVCITVLFLGCSKENSDKLPEDNPHTSHPKFETEVSPEFQARALSATEDLDADLTPKLELDSSIDYYVYASRLNVRSGPSIDDPIVGALNINNKVQLISGEVINGYVEIENNKSGRKITDQDNIRLYTAFKYLSEKKNPAELTKKAFKYFMIQNLATEKMRLYEKKCSANNCSHKLILETDIAVGEGGETETIAGYFHISEWIKFYQDGAGLYPSWYHPDYNMPPKPGASVRKWAKNSYLPYKGAQVRGAFGWYTAKVAPNARYQWTHGTLGWGSDKKEYIDVTRGFWANLFFDPRSHGCTRTDNESIAFIRELLEVGTPILKVYAKEAYQDPSRSKYRESMQTWDYILTKNGSRTNGQKSGRETVLSQGTRKNRWLEEGTYELDAYPNAKVFLKGSGGAKSSTNGNVYGLNHSDMRGVLLVDAGTLVDYKHPYKVSVGGYKHEILPSFAKASINTEFFMPDCPVQAQRDRATSGRPRDRGYDRPKTKNTRCSERKPI